MAPPAGVSMSYDFRKQTADSIIAAAEQLVQVKHYLFNLLGPSSVKYDVKQMWKTIKKRPEMPESEAFYPSLNNLSECDFVWILSMNAGWLYCLNIYADILHLGPERSVWPGWVCRTNPS